MTDTPKTLWVGRFEGEHIEGTAYLAVPARQHGFEEPYIHADHCSKVGNVDYGHGLRPSPLREVEHHVALARAALARISLREGMTPSAHAVRGLALERLRETEKDLEALIVESEGATSDFLLGKIARDEDG